MDDFGRAWLQADCYPGTLEGEAHSRGRRVATRHSEASLGTHSGGDPARCQNSCTAYTAALCAAALREFCESAAHFMSMWRHGASRDSVSAGLVAGS